MDALRKPIRHQKRANEAFDRILLASRTGQGPFKAYRLPQECRNYPNNLKDERDLANFLFVNLLHQAGGNNAESSFRGHRRLHERWPEIYDPRTATRYSADEIREMMKAVGLTLYKNETQYSGRRPEWLLRNAEILNLNWGSDPRNIFLGLPKNEIEIWWALIDRVVVKTPWKLLGIQEKVLALFVHLFVDAQLIDPIDVPGPIDIHQGRFLGSLELVGNGQRIGPWKELNAFRDEIRRCYMEYSHSRDVTMLEIGEAVWFYSREMCKYAPGAISENGKFKGIAELTPESGKRPGKWKPYKETCGNCIVSDLCNWNMPHSYHYNRGRKQGGLVFVPRPKMPDEKATVIDPTAPRVIRCTRHQGNYWNPDPTVGCTGCGECGLELDLPVRLQNNNPTKGR